MMKPVWTSAVTLAVLVQSHLAVAQDLASQLAGVWKYTGLVQKELATGTVTKPFGEAPGGTAFFTLNGHFSWIFVPGGQSVTDAERIALFSMASFGSGTHKVEGSSVILRYSASSILAWTGTERRAEMQVSGKLLTWTSAPYQSMDGKDLVVISTLERME